MTRRVSGPTRPERRPVVLLLLIVKLLLPTAAGAADERGTELPATRPGLRPIALPATDELDPSARTLIEDAERWVRELDGQHSDLGEAYGSLGRVYLAYEFDGAARDCFGNAAEIEPSRFQWQYYLGYTALRTADLEAAAAAFEAALILRPDDLTARARLGVVYRRSNRPEEARETLQRVLARSNDHAYAHSVLGYIELEQRNWSEGIGHLETALGLQPQATGLYNPLAQAYRQLGDRERARNLLEKRGSGVVAMADPLLDEARQLASGPRLLLHRGSVAARQGRTREALEIFEEALRADPGNAVAHYNVGALYLGQRQTDRAIAEFRRALDLDPGYHIARLNLGTVLSQLGRYEEALEQLERALEIDPADPATRQNLANAQVRAGRCSAAVEHYGWLVERDPATEAGWIGQIQCLSEAGDFAATLDKTREALGVVPESPRLREAKVRLLAASPDAAVRDGAEAVRVGEKLFAETRSLTAAEALAMAYAESERFEDAARLQRMAIDGARRGRSRAQLAVLEENLRLYEREEPCREPWR